MLGWGFALFLVGSLSFVLPMLGRQFVLVTLFGLSGIGSSIAGTILIFFGVALILAAFKRESKPAANHTAQQNAELASYVEPTKANLGDLLMETRRDIAAEGAVTLEWLETIFDGAFMPTVDRLDNILWIKGKRLTIQVILASDRKAINLVLMHSLVLEANFLNASLAANNCNARFGWCRFYIRQIENTKQYRLLVDFTLLFERGLIPYHLIRSFENLEVVALKGIEAEFLQLIP